MMTKDQEKESRRPKFVPTRKMSNASEDEDEAKEDDFGMDTIERMPNNQSSNLTYVVSPKN